MYKMVVKADKRKIKGFLKMVEQDRSFKVKRRGLTTGVITCVFQQPLEDLRSEINSSDDYEGIVECLRVKKVWI